MSDSHCRSCRGCRRRTRSRCANEPGSPASMMTCGSSGGSTARWRGMLRGWARIAVAVSESPVNMRFGPQGARASRSKQIPCACRSSHNRCLRRRGPSGRSAAASATTTVMLVLIRVRVPEQCRPRRAPSGASAVRAPSSEPGSLRRWRPRVISRRPPHLLELRPTLCRSCLPRDPRSRRSRDQGRKDRGGASALSPLLRLIHDADVGV
jgi:hypothetical protein